MDTPETVDPRRPVERFGKEASAFTKRMVEGKKVRLEYDQDRRDRFGRTLAYVYLEDGTFNPATDLKLWGKITRGEVAKQLGTENSLARRTFLPPNPVSRRNRARFSIA